MIDLIIFSIKESYYAINLEQIKRIIQVPNLTEIPNAHELIEGMMSYENDVIKVVGFRQMLDHPSFSSELHELFEKLKEQHLAWVEALKSSIERGVTFEKTTNPHMCELGKWLDSFTSYNDEVSHTIMDLNKYHKRLHNSAIDVLALLDEDKKDEALEFLNTEVYEIYNNTISYIDSFITHFDLVADSLQKLLLYQDSERIFAIKVDTIDDILHVEESVLKASQDQHKVNKYLGLEGVIEIDSRLINVIKNVTLPSKEVV